VVHVNLLPKDVQQSLAHRRRVRRWTVALALAAVGVCIPLGAETLQYTRIHRLRQVQADLQAQVRDLRKELERLTVESERVTLLSKHAESLRSKRNWSGLLHVMGTCLPESCWLASAATEPHVPPAASPRAPTTAPGAAKAEPAPAAMEAPRKLRLTGYAADPALPHVFVKNLKDTRLFTTVLLARAAQEPTLKGSYLKFDLECEW
jgi:hypothetical protein